MVESGAADESSAIEFIAIGMAVMLFVVILVLGIAYLVLKSKRSSQMVH